MAAMGGLGTWGRPAVLARQTIAGAVSRDRAAGPPRPCGPEPGPWPCDRVEEVLLRDPGARTRPPSGPDCRTYADRPGASGWPAAVSIGPAAARVFGEHGHRGRAHRRRC